MNKRRGFALVHRGQIWATSTAAGPAFEGGNLRCGMASVPGAICAAEYSEAGFRFTTIAGEEPKGVCGSGAMEIVAELVEHGLIGELGAPREGFDGAVALGGAGLVFGREDISAVQLAKAAIRAGVELLFHRSGVSFDAIEQVYIAGGFGRGLDCAKAARIGLLPGALAAKALSVGNSALGGVVQYAFDPDAAARCAKIKSMAQDVNLCTDPQFEALYVENLCFEHALQD